VLRRLPDLRTLMLNVGTNFVPEHLQELFQEPRPGIERMELRFRPYVEQASYYQFLKGECIQLRT
jgi:diketogulonate reductase-like aldo/keto reductase